MRGPDPGNKLLFVDDTSAMPQPWHICKPGCLTKNVLLTTQIILSAGMRVNRFLNTSISTLRNNGKNKLILEKHSRFGTDWLKITVRK
jgi:hypothetical protein